MKIPALLVFILLPLFGASAEKPVDSTALHLVPALGWDIKKQGAFPISLARDRENNLWVGTEGNGLWKYDAASQTWTQFTTRDGLGDDCVYALAIDRQDRIWAGHLNHGVSVFNGENWRNYGLMNGPLGDHVFDIAISPKDGGIWIATDLGLAHYAPARDDWDYFTRASGLPCDQVRSVLFNKAGDLRADTQNGVAFANADEDYTKWRPLPKPGAWTEGPAGMNPETFQNDLLAAIGDSGRLPSRTMLQGKNGAYFAVYGGIGGGLTTTFSTGPLTPPAEAKPKGPPAKLPQPAPPAEPAEANVFSARLAKISQEMKPGEAVYLADDWRTQGDWIGRYGGGYALLCGMGDKGDETYALYPDYEVSLELAPHRAGIKEEDLKSSTISLLRLRSNLPSDDRRLLYDPTLGERRSAAIMAANLDPAALLGDDQSGLWVRVKAPEGVHCLSLYFVNDDAHENSASLNRNYDLQIGPWSAKEQAAPVLAQARVADFWGGVYKEFMICGPAEYVVRIGRSHSADTRLQGVFLDRVSGEVPDNPGTLPGFADSPYAPPDEPLNQHYTPLADAAVNLWGDLDDALTKRAALPLQMPFRIWCYRAALAGKAPETLLERWRWQISIWTPEDRQRFDAAVKAAHKANP